MNRPRKRNGLRNHQVKVVTMDVSRASVMAGVSLGTGAVSVIWSVIVSVIVSVSVKESVSGTGTVVVTTGTNVRATRTVIDLKNMSEVIIRIVLVKRILQSRKVGLGYGIKIVKKNTTSSSLHLLTFVGSLRPLNGIWFFVNCLC